MIHADLPRPDAHFPSDARLLDAGGWLKPWLRATHVVDLMPYETRCGHLLLKPRPGEHFTKATWTQINFLQSGMRLPFPDGYFDFVFCGHTIEDLKNPEALLKELGRVARAGCIETPSRLTERAAGVRDRICDEQGYGHHHWIIDVAGDMLELSPKTDSLPPTVRDHLIPLFVYERRTTLDPRRAVTCYRWDDAMHWRFITPEVARERARDFARSLSITPAAVAWDRIIRRLRHFKRTSFYPAPPGLEDWWEQMVTISQPYSTIPL